MKIVNSADDLQSALDQNRFVQMGPGRFELEQTLVIPSGTRLSGCGMGVTTLARKGDYPYALIQNQQTGGEFICVEEMTLDCAGVSFLGVNLFGSNHTVRNVQIKNHVSPMMPGGLLRQESFAVLLSPAGPSRNLLVEGCLITDFLGSYNGGIAISGGNDVPCEGTIRNCRYYGSTTAEAFDFIGVFGASVVEGCWMEDVAVGIYTEGGPGSMIARNNVFKGVRGSAIRINLLRPQRALYAYGNHIELAGGAVLTNAWNENQLEEMVFSGNTISGTEPRCELSGVKWKKRKVQKQERTVVGKVTLEGDWKKMVL